MVGTLGKACARVLVVTASALTTPGTTPLVLLAADASVPLPEGGSATGRAAAPASTGPAQEPQRAVVPAMQTRDELYRFLDYHAYEEKLDALFAAGKR